MPSVRLLFRGGGVRKRLSLCIAVAAAALALTIADSARALTIERRIFFSKTWLDQALIDDEYQMSGEQTAFVDFFQDEHGRFRNFRAFGASGSQCPNCDLRIRARGTEDGILSSLYDFTENDLTEPLDGNRPGFGIYSSIGGGSTTSGDIPPDPEGGLEGHRIAIHDYFQPQFSDHTDFVERLLFDFSALPSSWRVQLTEIDLYARHDGTADIFQGQQRARIHRLSGSGVTDYDEHVDTESGPYEDGDLDGDNDHETHTLDPSTFEGRWFQIEAREFDRLVGGFEGHDDGVKFAGLAARFIIPDFVDRYRLDGPGSTIPTEVRINCGTGNPSSSGGCYHIEESPSINHDNGYTEVLDFAHNPHFPGAGGGSLENPPDVVSEDVLDTLGANEYITFSGFLSAGDRDIIHLELPQNGGLQRYVVWLLGPQQDQANRQADLRMRYTDEDGNILGRVPLAGSGMSDLLPAEARGEEVGNCGDCFSRFAGEGSGPFIVLNRELSWLLDASGGAARYVTLFISDEGDQAFGDYTVRVGRSLPAGKTNFLIPLPPAVLALGAGLGVFGAFGARRRKSRQARPPA